MAQKISFAPRIIFFFIVLTFFFCKNSISQNLAGSDGNIEPRTLIDKPTAGMMKRGSFGLGVDFFQQGGVLVNLNAGVMNRLCFGISYGGNNIVGSNNVEWNKSPGVNIKFRLFDENGSIPAIALGFDSQGKEDFMASIDRYRVKSLGFYAVASRNLDLLGFLSLHGGVNRSLENKDNNGNVNIFLGLEKTVGEDMSFVAEYDFAYNDNKPPASIGHPRHLNTGIRWNIGDGFMLGANFKDINSDNGILKIGNRTIAVEYIKIF